jgi:hypothetical protein
VKKILDKGLDMNINKEKLENYFVELEKLNSEDMMKLVEKHMDEDTVEIFVDHIEEFYGIADDDELGTLAQIMISGFIAAKELS